MPNIASVLKSEVTRLARKELRSETDSLKKALAGYRSEISALKKRVQELEKQSARASRTAKSATLAGPTVSSEEPNGTFRFRAAGMASNRKRLGLSAADFGLLVGATGQSVYAWEAGKTKPKPENLVAIASLRGIGKRVVDERLATLK